MKNYFLILTIVLIAGCSSSAPTSESPTPPPPAGRSEAPRPTSAPKRYTPAKPMKCKFDTDCVVLDTCTAGKCKIGGNDCRFRSDCPSPRATCVADKCEFN